MAAGQIPSIAIGSVREKHSGVLIEDDSKGAQSRHR
jgi:hypothetical protein